MGQKVTIILRFKSEVERIMVIVRNGMRFLIPWDLKFFVSFPPGFAVLMLAFWLTLLTIITNCNFTVIITGVIITVITM